MALTPTPNEAPTPADPSPTVPPERTPEEIEQDWDFDTVTPPENAN